MAWADDLVAEREADTAFREALDGLLPDDIVHASGMIEQVDGPLLGSEHRTIDGAVRKRRVEFRAGRVLARRALAGFGLGDRPIPAAPDRRPLWPDGIVGSIAHDDELAVAVVGSDRRWRGLGIDIEPATPLDADLHSLVLQPDERAVSRAPVATPKGTIDRAKAAFCAKEALFKAVYPITSTWFDLLDARVEFPDDASRFEVSIIKDAARLPDGFTMEGRLALAASRVIAFVGVQEWTLG